MEKIHFHLEHGAKKPTKAYEHDAGWDLYSPIEAYINMAESVIIDTGVSIRLPPEWSALILPRSGVSDRRIHVFPAVIDNGYRGSLRVQLTLFDCVIILNERIHAGDRIAQLVLIPVPVIQWVSVADKGDLGVTDRQKNGIGSSGR